MNIDWAAAPPEEEAQKWKVNWQPPAPKPVQNPSPVYVQPKPVEVPVQNQAPVYAQPMRSEVPVQNKPPVYAQNLAPKPVENPPPVYVQQKREVPVPNPSPAYVQPKPVEVAAQFSKSPAQYSAPKPVTPCPSVASNLSNSAPFMPPDAQCFTGIYSGASLSGPPSPSPSRVSMPTAQPVPYQNFNQRKGYYLLYCILIC